MEGLAVYQAYYQESARRFVDHYVALAEQAEHQMIGPQQITWLERLNEEFENLRTTLLWAIDYKQPEYGLRLVGALLRFWNYTEYAGELVILLNQLLAVRDGAYWTAPRARALAAAGTMARKLQDYETAQLLFVESLTIANQLDDPVVTANALNGLGSIALYTDKVADAIELYQEAAEIWYKRGEQSLYATKLHNLGICYHVIGDYQTALGYFREGLAILQKMQCQIEAANTLDHLGNLLIDLGEYEEAYAALVESLTIFNQCGIEWGVSEVLERFMALAIEQGQYERGLHLAGLVSVIKQRRPPFEQVWYTKLFNKAYQMLGETTATCALKIGQQMNVEQGIRYALDGKFFSNHLLMSPALCDLPIPNDLLVLAS